MSAKTYEQICTEAIIKFGLAKDKRVGFFCDTSFGDMYYALAAAPFVQQQIGIEFVFITWEGSPLDRISQCFKEWKNNPQIVYIDKCCFAVTKASTIAQRRFHRDTVGRIHKLIYRRFPQLFNRSTTREVKAHLARPVYKTENAAAVFKSLNLTPGQTVFIIPKSDWNGELGTPSLQGVISIFRCLGYQVVVNSEKDMNLGDGVYYIYPNVDDLVPFVDLCGFMFGMRSGLTEIVAAESSARITIVDHDPDPIENWYPFIPKDALSYIHINNIRTPLFEGFVESINSMLGGFLPGTQYFSALAQTASLPPRQRAHLISASNARANQPFEKYILPACVIRDFCEVEYATEIKDNLLLFYIYISPSLNYEIHACLQEAHSGEILSEINFSNSNPLVFRLKESGSYKVFMKLYHPNKRWYCQFTSYTIDVAVDEIHALASCVQLPVYIRLLGDMLERIIVFVVGTFPASGVDATLIKALASLGVQLHPWGKSVQACMTIIDSGTATAFPGVSEPEQEIRCKFENYRAMLALICSEGAQPCASIKIDGNEESTGLRGLSFVVWDAVEQKVIDSVTFDTFIQEIPASRLNPVYRMPAASSLSIGSADIGINRAE